MIIIVYTQDGGYEVTMGKKETTQHIVAGMYTTKYISLWLLLCFSLSLSHSLSHSHLPLSLTKASKKDANSNLCTNLR